MESTHNSIKIRIIKRATYGLGFYLTNDREAAVISGLVVDCEAEKSRLVLPGDRISAVNSIHVEAMTFAQVLAILEKIPAESPVVLLLKGPANCHTRLVTFFGEDGAPHTTRITEPVSSQAQTQTQAQAQTQTVKTDATVKTTIDGKSNGDIAASSTVQSQLMSIGTDLQQRLTRIEDFIQQGAMFRPVARTDSLGFLPALLEQGGTGQINGGGGGGAGVVPSKSSNNFEEDIPPGSPGLHRRTDSQSSLLRSANSRASLRRRSILTAPNSAQIIPSQTGDSTDESFSARDRRSSITTHSAHNHITLGRKSSNLEPSSIMSAGDSQRNNRSPSPTSMSANNKKYVKLKYLVDGKTTMDTLYRQSSQTLNCNPHRCTSSLLNTVRPQNSLARPKEEVLSLAKDFIRQYFESIKRYGTPAHVTRWNDVEAQINETGNYEFKEQELTFAAKSAWRNSQRCIGRIQWTKLQVFDARFINTPRTMFEALLNHIKYATNRGNIRSAITIFKQRTTPETDFRIWNQQIIRYAGYKQEDGSIIGDPASTEFTETCQKLGWKGANGRFDILPIVVSASGQDPELFDIPKEIVLQVMMKHAEYPKFAELDLKWYAVPVVSNMLFDVGGIFFPAVAFSGWYMNTEIARDYVDVSRYNLLEDIANVFNLDTSKISSLWKDQAFLELNKAILYSFQSTNTTIVDHHSASESFMKHLENEQKVRGGCPADWVWIVPPLGGSLLPVFHQEMLDYRLSPCYDYQEEAWRVHVWKKDKSKSSQAPKSKRKFGFREIARAVKFSAKLMSKALARRIRATIIFATETGKSERYAKALFDVFKYGFDVNVISADHYDLTHLEHEALLLIVTSTFGNGDPPDNGKEFAGYLHQLSSPDENFGHRSQLYTRTGRNVGSSLDRQETVNQDNFMESGGPLGNVRFAVFGLGSSSYPHFCAFAHHVDQSLRNLGGECILPIHTGDELNGQDQSFKKWATEVFRVACDDFCLGDDVNMADANAALSQGDSSWTRGRYRLRPVTGGVSDELPAALGQTHNKNVQTYRLKGRRHLQSKESTRQTILVEIEAEEDIPYHPGDHVALFAQNDTASINGLLDRLGIRPSPSPMQVEVLVEKAIGMTVTKTWKRLDRLPLLPLDMLFASILDITTPPSQMLCECLASLALDPTERERLMQLSKNTEQYENWKRFNWPTLLEVLDEFPSVEVDPTLLLVELPLLQPRFYSISSSALTNPKQIDATIGLVAYLTKGGNGPVHNGVCSSYLNKLPLNEKVFCYIRSASTFHLPSKLSMPIYLIGAGTGIAPFRSFWQHFEKMRETKSADKLEVSLIFGCRNSKLDHIYRDEIEALRKNGTIQHFYLALSREHGIPKAYVQSVIPTIAEKLFADISQRGAHIYVCGDVGMAAGVHDAIRDVCLAKGLTEIEAVKLLDHLRSSDRYHEDIFGNYNMASGY
ncbi:Nitric oxide synthase, brain [Hypsibius exemplaris]|uniref:Nitric oxide synthase 1 n=1 Tax=Hypsibius exemplaris TaxID=2072580 RepID=A0A9X6RKA8_HYPEX|nr:Nitric oxide synthase, brain [Hypsibius exemplaris]